MPVLVGLEGEGISADQDTFQTNEDSLGRTQGPESEAPTTTTGASGPTTGDHNTKVNDKNTPEAKEGGTRPRKNGGAKKTPGAETGRPETAKEFAACMSRHFVLKAPQQRKEGEEVRQKKLTIRIPARKSQEQPTQKPNIERPDETETGIKETGRILELERE
ncbi:hypothetical protein C0993_003930, partial [Termitomyces sp. T159_Od127]